MNIFNRIWFIDERDERDIYFYLKLLFIHTVYEIQEIFFYVLLKNDYISLRKNANIDCNGNTK